jgi:hypothetical protein
VISIGKHGSRRPAAWNFLRLPTIFAYEKMGDLQRAKEYYSLANAATLSLPDEGYGNMIRKGISAGLARMEKYSYDYPDKKSV